MRGMAVFPGRKLPETTEIKSPTVAESNHFVKTKWSKFASPAKSLALVVLEYVSALQLSDSPGT